jgi:hypothetical protein
MSVAFTKEGDSEAAAADLPDRPISPHPNLVTASGLARLEADLAAARAAYAAAQKGDVAADRTAMARATRDLRYYNARRATAQQGFNGDGYARFRICPRLPAAFDSTRSFRLHPRRRRP